MFTGLILLLFSNFAHAKTLSYPDCVEIASGSNPELLAARENHESSQLLLRSATSPFLPALSAGLSASSTDSSFGLTDPRYTSNLTLSYNLFSGLKDRAKWLQAHANERIAKANLDSARAKASHLLKTAFAQYRYASDFLELSERIRERRSQNERIVRAQYEAGRENEGSYLLSKTLTEQAEFEKLQASNQLAITRQNLAHHLGISSEGLEVNGDPILHAAPEKMNFEIAVKHIPTSRLFEAQLDLADGNRQQALSGFFPTLDFTAGISLTDQHLLPESNRLWSLGLSLNLPLFNGLKTYHDLRSTKALEIAAHRNQDANEFENLTLLKQTLATYQESEVKLRVDQNALKAATVRATIARKRYNNGLLNFEQWDIIESDLINRQKAAITSKRERINAESAYMQALGEGDLP